MESSFALSPSYGLKDPAPFLTKNLSVRIIVFVTCSLSMLGALLIVLSFACCKDLRSRGRQILVNISIMDFGVAASNLSGAAVYFDQFFQQQTCINCTTYPSVIVTPSHCHNGHQTTPYDTVMCPKSATIMYLCLAQACFSAYFTYGSILWTNSLCLYLYFRIVHNGTKISQYCLYISYIFCYTMPLLLTLWLALTGRLGYSPYESSGWCSILLMHPETKKRDIYASVFGYNLWIIVTFIFIPILSCAVHMNVKTTVKNTALYRRSDKFLLALLSVDYKFLLIPLAFIFLRLWSFIGDIIHLYVGIENLNEKLSLALIIMEGIGDSGQGITNSLIFLFFTKKFRDNAKSFCCEYILKRTRMNIQNHDDHLNEEGADVTRSLLDSTSVENISPHNFTYQSYENTTPVSLNVDK